ncbi:MAG: NusG domain II-containing protein [bacterium]
MTKVDKLLLGIIFLVIATGYLGVKYLPKQGKMVEIESPGGRQVIPLTGHPQKVTVAGCLGSTTLEIKNGKVRVVDSPCPQHICVKQGWKSRGGEVIVCLPNRIVVKVVGGESKDDPSTLDGVTQ